MVRVGESDIQIWECWYWPGAKGEMGRHWFEAPNGIQTATYREMVKELGGRPEPWLPEDEHRPAMDDNAAQRTENPSIPESGVSGIVENAFDHMDSAGEQPDVPAGDAKASAEPRNWEPFDPAKPLATDPWALDERDPEELSLEESTMQMIWMSISSRAPPRKKRGVRHPQLGIMNRKPNRVGHPSSF
jgi:hypothetical protein